MRRCTGNYTNKAAKTLEGSEHIICRVTDDDAICVTNGFVAHKMNPPEYATVARPVTCCEAGNYIMQNSRKTADNDFDLVKLFDGAVEQTTNTPALKHYPPTPRAGKAPAASHYNPTVGVTSFYNAKFIAALTPSATLRAISAISATVVYVGDEPLVLILPIKPEPKAARTAKAYFAEHDNDTTAEADKLRAELAQAQNEPFTVRDDLNRTANKIAELEAQQAVSAAEQPEPRTAARLITARFAGLAGVTTTIKDAQTAAPAVQLTGDTERHTDAIKVAGTKWSSKESAYYVHIA